MDDRDTIRRVKEGVAQGTIPHVFKPADVNKALKIDWAGVFLPKHRVGNPGGQTELFVQISRARTGFVENWSLVAFSVEDVSQTRKRVETNTDPIAEISPVMMVGQHAVHVDVKMRGTLERSPRPLNLGQCRFAERERAHGGAAKCRMSMSRHDALKSRATVC